MNSSWQGKRLLITGGSSGIGLETVAKALSLGAVVSVLSRTISEGLAKLDCDNLHMHQGSVSNHTDVQKWVEAARQRFGTFNTIINNAGAMYYMDVMAADYAQMKTMIETNCLGFINLIDCVLPLLKGRSDSHWLNITSDAGKQAFPGLAIYSGTKAFVEFSARAMRLELIQHNIKVTNIQPGNVATPLHALSTDSEVVAQYGSHNSGQYLQPADVANAITYAISTPHGIAVNEILIEPLSESI